MNEQEFNGHLSIALGLEPGQHTTVSLIQKAHLMTQRKGQMENVLDEVVKWAIESNVNMPSSLLSGLAATSRAFRAAIYRTLAKKIAKNPRSDEVRE